MSKDADLTGEGPPVAKVANASPGTAWLMASWFGVPLVIVSVILGCAVLVVLLFGSIATDRERSVASLLSVLESSSGERRAGVLLPREKELWQAARELALRLKKKDRELTDSELREVVKRLVALLARESAGTNELSEMGRKRMHFVMQALARTEAPEAAEPLASMLRDREAQTRGVALRALAEIGRTPQTRSVLGQMATALKDPDPTVRMLACASISGIAEPKDVKVIDALGRAYFDEDRDVKWNATLALARLGSARGKPLLLDMLDRSYWEKEVRVRTRSESGTYKEYPMPPQAVERYLAAAVAAASKLNDPEVWDRIAMLESDTSSVIKGLVQEVTKHHDQMFSQKE